MQHETEAAAALWARGVSVEFGWRGFGRFASHGVSCGFEGALAAAICEDSEVPDAMQAGGQGM